MNLVYRKRVVAIWVLPVFIVILIIPFLALPSQINTIPSSQLLDTNIANRRLMQTLYQIEALAAQTGWTADLAGKAGDIWKEMGDITRAVSYWQVSASITPSDVSLLRRLSEAFVELQRWPEAGDTLRLLVNQTPDDNWAHYHLGLIEAAFDPRSAIEHLRLAGRDKTYRDVALDVAFALDNPTFDSSVAMQSGLVLAGYNLWPYAELAFEQASILGAPFPDALAYTALAQDRAGKDGSQVIAQALALAPNNPQVLFLYGLHLRTRFDMPASLNAFLQANALDPDNPAFAAELGTAYRLVDDLGQAEAWLKTAVTLSNHDPRFQSLLDTFYADLNLN